MTYLLDTNIAIHARDGDSRVLGMIDSHLNETFLSALTLVELLRGLHARP